MNTKHYIVSEQELKELELMSFEGAVSRMLGYEFTERTDKAKAAVRARLVPEWATHFAGNTLNTGPDVTTWKFEEIKK